MDTTLQVNIREKSGKGWARKVRAAGKVPGVIYGPKHDARSVELDPEPLVELFRQTGDRNTIVQVSVDGNKETIPCLVREVQRHPVRRDLLHVDLYAVPTDKPIEVLIPINAVGRPMGALLGGRLRLIRRQVAVMCPFDGIPSSFEVDVSPLDIGDIVKASDLPLPDGVSLVFDNDYNVLTLYGKKK